MHTRQVLGCGRFQGILLFGSKRVHWSFRIIKESTLFASSVFFISVVSALALRIKTNQSKNVHLLHHWESFEFSGMSGKQRTGIKVTLRASTRSCRMAAPSVNGAVRWRALLEWKTPGKQRRSSAEIKPETLKLGISKVSKSFWVWIGLA